MIAFITSPERVHQLTIQESESYEVLNDTKDIKAIVNRLKNAQHYSHIIIDYDFLDNSEQEVVSQLYLFKAMNNTNLILIAQGKDSGDTLLSELVKIGIYNFVLSFDEFHMMEEWQDCLQGVSYEDVSHFVIQEVTTKKSLFPKKVPKSQQTVTIGVGGVCSRIGTTTQAVRLVRSLINNGYTACYVEENNSNHVTVIKEVFTATEDSSNGLVQYAGIPMYYEAQSQLDKKYAYIIHDFGVLTSENNTSFSQHDIKILVAGSKAWEMTALASWINQDNMNYLFSFTDKKEQDDLLDFMADNWTKTHFAEYSPDMFAELSDTEKLMYNKIINNKKTNL